MDLGGGTCKFQEVLPRQEGVVAEEGKARLLHFFDNPFSWDKVVFGKA